MHTSIYNKDKFIRREKLCNLKEFIAMKRLEPGQCLLIGQVEKDASGREYSCDTEKLFIGNCTPEGAPWTDCTKLDRWEDYPGLGYYVLEVHTF
jgi:hypothetical protein